MSKTASRTGASSSSTSWSVDMWRSESQLHTWKQLQDPGTFFQTCCMPIFEKGPWSSARRYGRAMNLRLQEHWKRKRKSPGEINVERIGQDSEVGASLAWLYSLTRIFLSTEKRSIRGSDPVPARQTETREYEPCVNLTLRPRNKVKFRSNIASMEFAFFASFLLSLFLFFTFYIFLETSKV